MEPAVILTCLSLVAIDGDTVRCDGVRLRPMGDGAPYVSGFDAPEINGRQKCAAELELGLKAKARMMELLATPGLLVEDSGAQDPFGRPLVWLRLPDGSTVGRQMLREGLAKEWRPNRANDWCESG